MPADRLLARRAAHAIPGVLRMREYWPGRWGDRTVYPERRSEHDAAPEAADDAPKVKKVKPLPEAWRLIDVRSAAVSCSRFSLSPPPA